MLIFAVINIKEFPINDKKKINLFIHPSYNKTGTTFLQEKIFNTKGFVTLCRPFDDANEQKKN